MRRSTRNLLAHGMGVLILSIALPAPALQAPSKSSPPTASGKAGEILVDTDDSCRLIVDGQDQGVIKPDEAKKVVVRFGDHLAKCTVEGIPDLTWRKVVGVKDSNQVVVLVSLKALHVQYAEATSKLENETRKQPDALEAKKPDQTKPPETPPMQPHGLTSEDREGPPRLTRPAAPSAVAIGILFDQRPATNSGGLVVTGVLEGGPAAQAGLKIGDTMLSLDGQPVSTAADFLRLMAGRTPGSVVPIKFRRDVSGLASRDGNGTKRGIRVARSDGFWREMNLHTGDTILEVNKVKVSSEQQFRTFLSSLSQGRDVVLLVLPANDDALTVFVAGTLDTDPETAIGQIGFEHGASGSPSSESATAESSSRTHTALVTLASVNKLFANGGGAGDGSVPSNSAAPIATDADYPFQVQFFNVSGKTWHIRWRAGSDDSCNQPIATRNDIAGEDTVPPLQRGSQVEIESFPAKIVATAPSSGHRFACPRHGYICMDTDTDLSRMQNFEIVKCDSVQYMKEQGHDGRFISDREFLLGNILGVSSR